MYKTHNCKYNTKIDQHCIKHYMKEINKYKGVYVFKQLLQEADQRQILLSKKNKKIRHFFVRMFNLKI